MFSRDIDINVLPIEVLLNVFSYLAPEDIASAGSITTKFKFRAEDNSLWEKKFKIHFPHAISTFAAEDNINWYTKFRDNYEKDYKKLPVNIRKLFSLVKEGDFHRLQEIKIRFEDLDKQDQNGVSLLDWAKKKGDQVLLDFFYQLVIKEFTDVNGLNITKVDSSNGTILHWAIYCHQPTETIDNLILQGANFNCRNTAGSTLLLFAIKYGKKNAIDILLKHNANITIADNDGNTPLHLAIILGRRDVVEALLNKGADPNAQTARDQKALITAAIFGHAEIVELLIERGADINTKNQRGDTALSLAIKYGHKNVTNVLLKNHTNITIADDNGNTPLHLAIIGCRDLDEVLFEYAYAKSLIDSKALLQTFLFGQAEIVELLIKCGANINTQNKRNETALLLAIERGHKNIINVLLKNHANITIADENGTTPLHLAIVLGCTDVVKALLEYSNAQTTIASKALITAAKFGHAEIVQLLIKRGADINTLNDFGDTALILAIERGHKNVVDVLLDHNADITLASPQNNRVHKNGVAGDTPLHIASRLGRVAIVQQLLKRGADIEQTNSKGQTAVDVAVYDSRYSNELKLLDYSLKVNRRPANHYKTSFTFFGYTIDFGYSAKQKQDAADALKSVIFDNAEKSCLDKHQEVLNNGELGSIFSSLQCK